MASSIRPFQIAVPDSKLEELNAKLSLATFPDDLPMSESWDYGVPVSDLKRLVSRWKDGFDWRAEESKLNQLPHYTAPIVVDGFGELDIHFLHQKSERPGSIPLLFCHGCAVAPLRYRLQTRPNSDSAQGLVASSR